MWLWEPRPDVFPSGMQPGFWPLPLALHNRYFALNNSVSGERTTDARSVEFIGILMKPLRHPRDFYLDWGRSEGRC